MSHNVAISILGSVGLCVYNNNIYTAIYTVVGINIIVCNIFHSPKYASYFLLHNYFKNFVLINISGITFNIKYCHAQHS